MFKFSFCSLILLLSISCSKTKIETLAKTPDADIGFTKYIIEKGKQFCNNNSYVVTSYSKLKFLAKFDSSAIYKTIDPGRQNDINKLYGFSDNNTTHHQFSARFGWRWSNNELRLFGYIYNDGLNEFKDLGTVALGAENVCAIKVTPTAYHFLLNGKTDSLPRTSKTIKAEGYKLYPYFGGNESAPHTINIFIKEF